MKSFIKILLSLWAVMVLISFLPSCLNLLSQSNWIEPPLGVLVLSLDLVGLIFISRVIGSEVGKLVGKYLDRKNNKN